jgi:hypothetical protein
VALEDDIDSLPTTISAGITPQINGHILILHRTAKSLKNLIGHTAFGRSVLKSANAEEARGYLGAGTSSLTLGTTSTTAAAGNDSRLSDNRTPVSHQHLISDINASGTKNSTTFLAGDGTWKVPGDVSGEIGYAEVGAQLALTTGTSMTDVVGFSLAFATTNRPVMVSVTLNGVTCAGDGTFRFRIVDASNAVKAEGIAVTTAAQPTVRGPDLLFRVPVSTAATTYRLQASRDAGSVTGYINSVARKAFMQAVRV